MSDGASTERVPTADQDRIVQVVVGTAGHIDHGKTSLLRRLTGIDADRLKEEKARGMTIDLGFAPWTLDDGTRIGIIDVPGHEKFVKNMVAGATGVDMALLVVAADDGVMPQTREHADILGLLGVTRGVVAMTKVDLVGPELRELAREELEEWLATTSLRDAPVIEVSSETGEGFDELSEAVERAAREAAAEQTRTGGPFRLPIQRVFSAPGHGTVITGVPVSGGAVPGDRVEITPPPEGRSETQTGRIRGIQAYKGEASAARTGHSSALALSDVDHHLVHRGMCAVTPGFFEPCTSPAVDITLLPLAACALEHMDPIRVHGGTFEAVGRLRLLDRKVLERGETAPAQLVLEEPVIVAPGDRLVIRRISPIITLGGATVLEARDRRLRPNRDHTLERLETARKALGDPAAMCEAVLLLAGGAPLSPDEVARRAVLLPDEAAPHIAALEEDGRAVRLSGRGQERLVHGPAYREARERLLKEIDERLEGGVGSTPSAEVRQGLNAAGMSDAVFDAALQALADAGEVRMEADRIGLPDPEDRLDDREKEALRRLEAAFEEGGVKPPTWEEALQPLGIGAKQAESLGRLLFDRGDLVRVKDGMVFHRTAVERAAEAVRATAGDDGEVVASEAKSHMGTSRKYAIPLLEHLDTIGVTVWRAGERRLRG